MMCLYYTYYRLHLLTFNKSITVQSSDHSRYSIYYIYPKITLFSMLLSSLSSVSVDIFLYSWIISVSLYTLSLLTCLVPLFFMSFFDCLNKQKANRSLSKEIEFQFVTTIFVKKDNIFISIVSKKTIDLF